jgi:hypothetical protein
LISAVEFIYTKCKNYIISTVPNKCEALSIDPLACIRKYPCHFCWKNTGEKFFRCNFESTLKNLGCKEIINITVLEPPTIKVPTCKSKCKNGPKKIFIEPGPSGKKSIYVTFTLEKLPIDLYYLADVSKSMTQYLNTVYRVGGKLKQIVEKISPDYRIGFGAFVDKNLAGARKAPAPSKSKAKKP